MSLSRRQFLIGAGGLAAAAAAGGLASVERLSDHSAGVSPAAASLRKCISLGGPGPLRQDDHPDDYRLWGNREYIRDLSGTAWVKLWVSWYDLQQELGAPPADRSYSWHQLDGAPGGHAWIRRLDRQIEAAQEDGVGVILTLHHTHPTWATGAAGADPADPSKPAEQKLPLDVSPDGPWAWFVAYLIARYRKRDRPGPSIDALEICNEPNFLSWPQEGIVETTAQMIRSAARLSATWGPTPILAPATSDFPDRTTQALAGLSGTVWSDFTAGVLRALAGFRALVPLRWSHHNYRDIRLGTARAEDVLAMLRSAGWASDVAPLWLTEGGLNLAEDAGDEAARRGQADAIVQSFERMRRLPDVYMWTQHTVSDKPGNTFKGGLRDDFRWSEGPGRRRPSWYAWRDLSG